MTGRKHGQEPEAWLDEFWPEWTLGGLAGYLAMSLPAFPFLVLGFLAAVAWGGLRWGWNCGVGAWEWVAKQLPENRAFTESSSPDREGADRG